MIHAKRLKEVKYKRHAEKKGLKKESWGCWLFFYAYAPLAQKQHIRSVRNQ